MPLSDRRRDYGARVLLEEGLEADPILLFGRWMEDALEGLDLIEANAMVLGTADPSGLPCTRTVLLKEFDERGFVFFTNYGSRKARELEANPRASLLFWWPPLERQVRIDGVVSRVSEEESLAYWRTRPRESRIGAWASRQSEVIEGGRAALAAAYAEMDRRYPGKDVPLPPWWGGYRVAPEEIEFWQGRANRLHDRIRYRRAPDGAWTFARLSP